MIFQILILMEYTEITLTAIDSQNVIIGTDLQAVIGTEMLKIVEGVVRFTPTNDSTNVTIQHNGLVLTSVIVSHSVPQQNVMVPNMLMFYLIGCVGNATFSHFNSTLGC